MSSLQSRYATYFGKKLKIFAVLTKDAHELEKQCHEKFAKNQIEGELFEPDYWSDYALFLEENAEHPDECEYSDDAPDIPDIAILDVDYDKILSANPNINDDDGEMNTILIKYKREDTLYPQFFCTHQIGICKDLREAMNISLDIPDNYIIIRYGFADNFMKNPKST